MGGCVVLDGGVAGEPDHQVTHILPDILRDGDVAAPRAEKVVVDRTGRGIGALVGPDAQVLPHVDVGEGEGDGEIATYGRQGQEAQEGREEHVGWFAEGMLMYLGEVVTLMQLSDLNEVSGQENNGGGRLSGLLFW